MQIGIQTRGFDLTEALRNYCERRMRFALGSASGRVRSVTVRLSDENGPKGGIDKRCSIRVALDNAPVVVIVQDGADAYVAIDQAADRTARTMSRRLEKKWAGKRSPAKFQQDSSEIDLQSH